ncbi:Hypothetical protein DEACI_1385 [Acididesulfobacillus acetoxydans]|uniref:Uncharacterized protein n=1 Tax=Acididesulfobacillus acetoxydans TaxID=1561005 RepID=A0A8S0WF73_9FIRM|nr:Hypothetical protein DEACI_1385 [Acididesulfobacillus acetoxydans]CEJ06159.1 Hypothetical protein DEACI_0605 [Acididesulfobacillus acetoxydans]
MTDRRPSLRQTSRQKRLCDSGAPPGWLTVQGVGCNGVSPRCGRLTLLARLNTAPPACVRGRSPTRTVRLACGASVKHRRTRD